ncbi:Auxin-responsive GH3-related protein [Morganella morganii]|uniref:Auxin-responsive GH3-related protein n=1 Tax=Morganella morganii TaxID=582 RepID=A0A433ZSX1_MORMO|nr:GH3 auxin-responsive promoter family protein [Morganella morganii]RUT65227.1 Auxin-responsive GH3-related protein [Morganella morganii]
MDNAWQHFRAGMPPVLSPGSLRERQFHWLAACLTANSACEYGRLYHFSSVKSVTDYQQSVPLTIYSELTPFITRLTDGEKNLLCSAPVLAFELTGGSRSGGKLLPYTAAGLTDFRLAVTGWLRNVIRRFDLTSGHVYWALSPAVTRMTQTPGGIPVGGGDALYLGADNLMAFSELSSVPLTVAQVGDAADWQLLTLIYLLQCPDLRLISVWSPVFLFPLLTALDSRQDEISALLRDGGELAGHSLNADPAALVRYRQYLREHNTALLWPQLALISCWDQAASASPAQALMAHFPGVTLQGKGLLSTEAVITVPSDYGDPQLNADSNFYEFRHDNGQIYLADELIPGETYSVIVTTNSGLYRYQTDDLVLCTGHTPEAIPQLRFCGRDGICSDLVGEKLTEPFVCAGLPASQDFAALAADEQGYVLLLSDTCVSETQARAHCEDTERYLCSNPQYYYARRIGQLNPLTYLRLHKPAEHYFHRQLQRGKRLGEIKIPALLTSSDWRAMFDIREFP